jgi:signal transduction histidine kinase
MRSWWLALAATAICGPWPEWDPSPAAVIGLSAALFLLARPHGKGWLPWCAVIVAVGVAVWPPAAAPDPDGLSEKLDAHCREMLAAAEEVASDRDLLRFLGAAGEALDPTLPFAALERGARGGAGRTAYLADDRGRVVAWGGAGHSYPAGVRPLGQRQWGVAWSAGAADLWLREPLLVEGRLVGTITVSDHTSLQAEKVWGMRAPRNDLLRLGLDKPGAVTILAPSSPGVRVDITIEGVGEASQISLRGLGWLLLVVFALIGEPRVAWAGVLLGGGSLVMESGPAPEPAMAVVVLLAGAAAGRLGGILQPKWARVLVVTVLLGVSVVSVLGSPAARLVWLPEHLVQPGWGGVWMVALAWLIVGWPGLSSRSFTFVSRLRVGALLALLGLALFAARVPVDLERSGDQLGGVMLPRGELDLRTLLPAPIDDCHLEDLAPVLAERWRLADWRTPSGLNLRGENGDEVSRWGDLSPAFEQVRVARLWELGDGVGPWLELVVATEPWSLLGDWRTGIPLEEARRGGIRFAVLTRSGEVAASLHPEIRDLDAITAGELFHAGSGWTQIEVGEVRRLARVRRHEQWLVAAIARFPSPFDWIVRTAIAMLWAFVGTLGALPPMVRKENLSTFGGRLRLLVAGGVVLPLAILTLFLHQRIAGRELRLEQARGLEALRAARYTAVHLGGSFSVDDEFARWLASGWGGEVSLWDGIASVASSRPDLMSTGVLPQLPVADAFPSFLLGRDDPMVLRWQNRAVASGPVDLQGQRLLLHLYRSDPTRMGSDLGAVDWLLTGALISALLALALTTGIERRLSVSLRELVALARSLLDGQPAEPIRRPRETDLAEVLDAVRTMNEEVQQRELSLRHQEELLRITLSTLAPAVVVLEPDGATRFANPSARRLEEEHQGLLLEQVRTVDEAAQEGDTVAETVQPVPGSDLTWRIGVAGVPFPDGGRGLVAVVDDITDLVRADRMRQLNQMARIVAHEVKNPLTPVRLWVQELEAVNDREDADLKSLIQEACREISVQVERLQETANSFSNLVALEHWDPEPVDLKQLLEEVPSAPKILERSGIRVVREAASPSIPLVMGDRQWLRRALANLVQNSVDSLAGGSGEIVLRLKMGEDRVILEVEDTGGGVPDERLPELFAPQFSTTTAGSGLGLALVHQVVVRCHGRVAASNGRRGLLVRLEFPPVSPLLR